MQKGLHVVHMTLKVIVGNAFLGKTVLITPPVVHKAAQVVAPVVIEKQAS
jgi:hypothetical protein